MCLSVFSNIYRRAQNGVRDDAAGTGIMHVLLMVFLIWWGQTAVHADDLTQNLYVSDCAAMLFLPAPAVDGGIKGSWLWASHDGTYNGTPPAQITLAQGRAAQTQEEHPLFNLTDSHELVLHYPCRVPGVYRFKESEAARILAKFEVFVIQALPPFGEFVKSGHAPEAQRGTDVTLACNVSRLPESSTLQWQKKGEPAPNTTLLYDKAAHILLHSVDQNSHGDYTCSLLTHGDVQISIQQTLQVSDYTKSKTHTVYRDSSDGSELFVMCKSKQTYDILTWIWELQNMSKISMITAKRGEKPVSDGPFESVSFSKTPYDGQEFNFHISPVRFSYKGTFKCFTNNNKKPYTSTILQTLRVSAVPPGGVSRNQTVVLTCELSAAADSLTLAWLRIEGGRGVLVKQELLCPPKKTLSLTLDSLRREEVNWECVVFSLGMFRARSSLTLTVLHVNEGRDHGEVSHVQPWMLAAGTVYVVAGVMFASALFCYRRKGCGGERQNSPASAEGGEEEEVQYSIIRPVTNNCLRRGETAAASDAVIYSAINFKP